MIRLNRSMPARYEIAECRPRTVRAAIFGSDRLALGVAARRLDACNRAGADLGAACCTARAEALRAQDGLFTMILQAETEEGEALREERVVQSILAVVGTEPEECDALRQYAQSREVTYCFVSAEAEEEEIRRLVRFLLLRYRAGLPAPCILPVGEDVRAGSGEKLRGAVAQLARVMPFREGDGATEKRSAGEEEGFAAWLRAAELRAVLADCLCGVPPEAERQRLQREMNYRDDFLLWSEMQLHCVAEGGMPEELRCGRSGEGSRAPACEEQREAKAGTHPTGGSAPALPPGCAPGEQESAQSEESTADPFAEACARKERIFDALVFLCVALGFFCGKENCAQVLREEKLRSFIARAFWNELLPTLPRPREEVSAYIIDCFARLDNPMNPLPLTEVGRKLLSRFPRTLLPALREHARRKGEAPPRLTTAFSAAILLYSGVRQNAEGEYEVERGREKLVLRDEEELLRSFSRLSRDMPPETLAYVVLADRELWGEDLRDIGGLEMRVAFDLGSMQRVGILETLRKREEELQTEGECG